MTLFKRNIPKSSRLLVGLIVDIAARLDGDGVNPNNAPYDMDAVNVDTNR